MPSFIEATGFPLQRFLHRLASTIGQEKPKGLGIAVAYASVYGVEVLRSEAARHGIGSVNLVTDISDCVTHPNAIASAIDAGWNVRIVDGDSTFHPKFYIGFKEGSQFTDPLFTIVGSANLSFRGFRSNIECSTVSIGTTKTSAVHTWQQLWACGAKATAGRLTSYQKRFAERNKARRKLDLVALGVADFEVEVGAAPSTPPTQPALAESSCSIAWAGLASTTGAYTLQLEFPQKAALVLQRLFSNSGSGNSARLLCSDNQNRNFKYRFYEDNGMFRLNIPNDVPDASWARTEKKGIGYVEWRGDDQLYFEIVRPGDQLNEITAHSYALGTWGRTSTRLYGWY